jgi:hypothetical protein
MCHTLLLADSVFQAGKSHSVTGFRLYQTNINAMKGDSCRYKGKNPPRSRNKAAAGGSQLDQPTSTS